VVISKSLEKATNRRSLLVPIGLLRRLTGWATSVFKVKPNLKGHTEGCSFYIALHLAMQMIINLFKS